MLGECNFLSSVLSQQKFEVTDPKALGASQLSDSVTAQFYLENENISLRRESMLTQKTQREERESACWRETLGPLAPLFICFFLSLGLPYVNWASQECLFYLRSSLRSLNLLLYYFHGLFPSLSFSHRHSGLLFPILTIPYQSRSERPVSWSRKIQDSACWEDGRSLGATLVEG